MKSNIALELVRVTEASALAAARTMGMGQIEKTHRAAVDAMSHTLNLMSIEGQIVLGEGPQGEEPSLYHGLSLGQGGRKLELLVLPIDGPTSCAQGGGYALSAVAAVEHGSLLRCPDVFFEKIAVGSKGKGVIDLNLSVTENLKNLANVQKSYVEDLTVAILDRPRHNELIREVRESGARIRLIPGGDLSGALAACSNELRGQAGVDLLMGMGRAREGLLAAAAVYSMGGDLQMRPKPMNRDEKDALAKSAMDDVKRIFALEELIKGEVFFAATGVTRSEFLEGVQFQSGGAISHSVVTRSASGTVRRIISEHHFDRKPIY